MDSKRASLRRMTGVGIFTAVVVILQLLGSFIRFGPFSISLVLVPIVVGAALYGKAAGAWLGFVFGVVVLLSGDAAAFLAVDPVGTVLTVLIKGASAGFAAGAVYAAVRHLSEPVAVIGAAIVCPVVNTGIFLLGCLIYFLPTVTVWGEAWAQQLGVSFNLTRYMLFGLVGGNFIFELLANIVLSPVIVRLVKEGRRK